MKQVLFLFLVIMLSACAKPSVESQIAEARQSVEIEAYQSAVISYKNVLLQQPGNSEIRAELGSIYLLMGQFSEAEKELEKAIERGALAEPLIDAIAKSIYYQSDYNRLVNRLDAYTAEGNSLSNQSTFFYYVSSIKSQLDRKESIPIPSELTDQNYLSLAKIFDALINNNPEAALTLSDDEINENVEPFENELYRATAYSMLGDHQNAILSYNKALEVYQTYHPLRFLLAEQMINAQQIDAAAEQIQLLIDLNPSSAYANYLLSIVLLYNEEFEGAFEASTLAIQGGIDRPKAHFIAGVSAYHTNKIEAAYRHLVAAAQRLPNSHIAHRLLAKVRFKLGYIEEIAGSLETLDLEKEESAQIYALAAVQSYQLNDTEKAQKYIEESLSINPESTEALLSKSIVEFDNDNEAAIKTLSKLLSINPNIVDAWTLKASAEYKENGIESAIQVAKGLQEKEALAGIMLEGLLYLDDKQEDKAQAAFEKAHKLAPDNEDISYYVLIANARADKTDKALDIAKQILDASPNNFEVIIDYSNLLLANNKDPLSFLDSYINEHPELPTPIAAKAYFLMRDGKNQEAVTLLKSSKTPAHYSKFMALGEAFLKTKRFDEASENYRNWTQAFPTHSRSWHRYIITLQYLKDYSQALAATNDALTYFPLDDNLHVLKAHFLVNLGEQNKAEAVLRNIPKKSQSIPEFAQISGTIAYNKGEYAKAFELINSAYIAKPTFSTARILAFTHAKLGRNKEGLDLLKNQIVNSPDAYYERFIIAEYASKNNLIAEAIQQYEILDKKNPDNFVVLNNLSNLLAKKGDLENAENLAMRTLQLQPQSPYSLSTFSFVLMKQKRFEESKRYIERALLKAPNNTEMLLQLTEILIEQQQNHEAKSLLDKLTPKSESEKAIFTRLTQRL
ncbi:PEP-CTERM system TPR-repeat protein PrsT [Alteromonas sp. 5E99-2]|uniref:XrtA/PEP-CTERM system TPR-repeat protein PrsT n=1 Tax=Alteromonas sp. 5E99-2 TaxID=2817683 RepID=UPI001A9886AC|nr:XrtA/PEP-CTERM system TPR-repeat protein PrsT [Alteromonas sp. 5E99-2]MBO1256532.1 PEP-CTERM system TPR-repeat protein PrsT [Alteromonas sp. 5E99-2]